MPDVSVNYYRIIIRNLFTKGDKVAVSLLNITGLPDYPVTLVFSN